MRNTLFAILAVGALSRLPAIGPAEVYQVIGAGPSGTRAAATAVHTP